MRKSISVGVAVGALLSGSLTALAVAPSARAAGTVAGSAMTSPPTTTAATTTFDARLDNPFTGGKGYVNPEWTVKAESVAGGTRVSNTPTAVWIDRISAIQGGSGKLGVRDHLDAALAQGANYVQFVLYDLPQRDCLALASDGELSINDLSRYKSEFIDPIAAIQGESKYRSLRIVNIIEPNSLTNLIYTADVFTCAQVMQSGVYLDGIAYALDKLHGAGPNIYNYLDAADHGELGWDTNVGRTVDLFGLAVKRTEGGYGTVDGFVTNVANYAATVEPYLGDINRQFNGVAFRSAKWIDWNQFYDEQSYAQAYRAKLISAGFSSSIGMVIDTSRNGWGGSDRPTGPSTSTDLDTFVNESRIDRRIHAGNYCNQAGAGLGQRPTAAPAPGIDAYAWVKPPGESDGTATFWKDSYDRMCDPTYTGNSRNGNNPTGALPNSPQYGLWFPAQFTELMANAYPPLDDGPTTTTTKPTTTTTTTTTTATTTTTTTTTKPTTTTSTVSDSHVDNPFQSGEGYVNPEWKANAESVAGGSRVSDTPTAVWIDRVAAIEGDSEKMGVRDHLDAALAQGADYIQFVLYDLPMRDCAALQSDGEFGRDDLPRYRSEFIDPIAAIQSDSKYRNLRIVNVIEPESLTSFIFANNVPNCAIVAQDDLYADGIVYALDKLGAAGPNVYNYLDAANHGLLGWDSNFGPMAEVFRSTVQESQDGLGAVDGFVTNVADYAATVEPYLGDISRMFNGVMFRSAKWIDWNQFYDELSFAQAFRAKLVGLGFPSSIGMLIDTGRNGWGGPDRPAGASTSTDLNTFVDESRIDRRLHVGNYCNQVGAGLGERPTAAPAAGIDAYVWARPPGESDGQYWEGWDGFGYDRMCDPIYGGNASNNYNPTGAMGNSPNRGVWFPAHFEQLMANAYPSLGAGPTTTTIKPTTTTTKPTTTTQGGETCKAVYKVVGQWPGGFQGDVTVTAGSSAISGWKVTWTFANGQKVQQSWNAMLTSSGSGVTASNVSWNGPLAAGAAANFGFIGSWATTNGIPAVTCVAT